MRFLIGGIKKTSLLDFPEKLSAIIFTQGCNFNCGFCHNPALLKSKEGIMSVDAFFDFLKIRVGKLDGVVITGGEPTLQTDLKPVIQKIKNMGFCVKLDTNGSNPSVIQDLLDNNLLDYIAMDIKAPLEKYNIVSNVKVNTDNIQKSIRLIMNSRIEYEFRTTFLPYYHEIDDFKNIGKLIKGAEKYYLQKFNAYNEINNPKLVDEENYNEDDIKKIKAILSKYVLSVRVR